MNDCDTALKTYIEIFNSDAQNKKKYGQSWDSGVFIDVLQKFIHEMQSVMNVFGELPVGIEYLEKIDLTQLEKAV